MNCPKISYLLVTFLLLIGCVIAQEPPDWAKRDYAAPADQVFAAALKSIQEQHHEVKTKDDGSRTVDFHVGTTAWSWGYNMRLAVTPIDENHARAVVEISLSGGKAVPWGSGKKEVRKILAGIDAELAGSKGGSAVAGHVSNPAQVRLPVSPALAFFPVPPACLAVPRNYCAALIAVYYRD